MSRYSGRLPQNFTEAERMLGNRQRRTILNNTTIERGGRNRVNVVHHGSVIGAFEEDGAVMLTNAGYGSVSTRERLNAMAGRRVSFVQRDFAQKILVGDWKHSELKDGGTVWIDRDGQVTV